MPVFHKPTAKLLKLEEACVPEVQEMKPIKVLSLWTGVMKPFSPTIKACSLTGLYHVKNKSVTCKSYYLQTLDKDFKFTMTGWKLVFLSVAVAALMLQDTASALPGELLLVIQSNSTNTNCLTFICHSSARVHLPSEPM